MSHHIWAPEIHHIDGMWYVYFAAGRAEDIWAIRCTIPTGTHASRDSVGNKTARRTSANQYLMAHFQTNVQKRRRINEVC